MTPQDACQGDERLGIGTSRRLVTERDLVGDQPRGNAQTLSVSPVSTSGLPVTLVSSTLNVCTVAGSGPFTVTVVGAGNCMLTANQSGSANFAPAAPVTITVAVRPESIPMLSDRMLVLLGLLLTAIGAGCIRFGQAGH